MPLTDEDKLEMKRLASEGQNGDDRPWTLQEVADEYGISRERVRQLIGNVGGHESLAARHLHNKRTADAVERAEQVRPEIVRMYRDEGWLLRDIATHFRIPDWRVSQVLQSELGDAFRNYRTRKKKSKYAKEDVRVALQRCAAELGHSPSTKEYIAWSPGKGVPSAPTITSNVYDSWAEAKRDAGLEVGRHNKGDRRRDYVPPDKCVQDVRQLWDLLGHPPTSEEYHANSPRLGLTSGATVRKRLGGWNAAIRAADQLGPLVPRLKLLLGPIEEHHA